MGNEHVTVVETDGTELVAVKRMDIPDANDPKAKTLIIADNRASEVGLTWDADVLKAWDADGVDLETWWHEDELAEMWGDPEPQAAPDAQIDRAAELLKIWQVQRGDVWEIPSKTAKGCHRIMCGDSTDADDVALLMNGEKAHLFATDPPYGVDYVKTKAGIPDSGYASLAEDYDNIEADHFQDEELQAFLESAFTVWKAYLDHAGWYLWHAHLTQGFFAAAAAAAAADVLLHRQIIWVKSGFNLTRSGMYHWAHEPCFFGWQRGLQPEWYGEKNQRSVWEIARHEGKGLHPTQKPPELWHAPILNHTLPSEICAEPFAGSGSQFIAAEQLGRLCYGMEISPEYCAVILQRASDMGLTPALVQLDTLKNG